MYCILVISCSRGNKAKTNSINALPTITGLHLDFKFKVKYSSKLIHQLQRLLTFSFTVHFKDKTLRSSSVLKLNCFPDNEWRTYTEASVLFTLQFLEQQRMIIWNDRPSWKIRKLMLCLFAGSMELYGCTDSSCNWHSSFFIWFKATATAITICSINMSGLVLLVS